METTINIGTEIDLQDLLQSRMLIQANSGGGKSVLARVIIEETFGKVPFIVMDIEGEYYTLKEKYGDVLIIGGQHADIPISLKSVKLLPKEIIGNRLSVVIDLSDLQMSDRIMYAKYFLETMMDLTKDYWINYLVFIEEAHKLCGEQDKQASATAIKDIMSRGRKRGYCGILLTQRISKLHKDAAAECNNKFIGRTFLDIDLDRAAKELGLSTQADKNIIRNLKPGSFYAFGTSIQPHEVHEVQINLPKTKVPRAGVNLDIKPKAPTEKIKAMLSKLNDLPAEAEKEQITIQGYQKEINRLQQELKKSTQVPTVNTELHALKIELSAKDKRQKYYEDLLKDIRILIDGGQPGKRIVTSKELVTATAAPTKEISSHTFPVPIKAAAQPSGKLGKCSLAILKFLAQYATRSFSKAQVGIAVGYSPNSGGFNNSLSELNAKGLLSREGGKMKVNQVENIYEWTGQLDRVEYSIETYKSKLGKCEREIYEVLISHPEDSFTKEQLADHTESKYSYNSGGFNNALSTLNTLELIQRANGSIRLNPELLELMS